MSKIKDIAKRIYNVTKRIQLNLTGDYHIESRVSLQHSKIDKYVSIFKDVNVVWSEIGKYTYIGSHTELPYCRIGKYCSIGSHVWLAEGLHPTEYVSTHPLMYGGMGYRMRGGVKIPHKSMFKEHNRLEEGSRLVCEIGNDVWIATGAIIAVGKKTVHIGDGAVIAAGAVVVGDVPDYAIVGGCPAKVIQYRFDEVTRERLLMSRWWDKDTDWLNGHIESYDDIKKFIEW